MDEYHFLEFNFTMPYILQSQPCTAGYDLSSFSANIKPISR